MTGRIIEITLDKRQEGLLSVTDLLRAVGADSTLAKAFEGVKITLDTGKLEDLIREAGTPGMSEEELKRMVEVTCGMLGTALSRVALTLFSLTAIDFVYGPQGKLDAFLIGLEGLQRYLVTGIIPNNDK